MVGILAGPQCVKWHHLLNNSIYRSIDSQKTPLKHVPNFVANVVLIDGPAAMHLDIWRNIILVPYIQSSGLIYHNITVKSLI